MPFRRLDVLLVAVLLVGCGGARAPRGRLSLDARPGSAVLGSTTGSGSGWARLQVSAPGASVQQETRERAWRLREAQVREWVLAAEREGRGAGAGEAAREAEVERVLAQVVGLASEVEVVGTRRAFTFWVEGGALTLVGYREDGGGGRAGRPVGGEELRRLLRLAFIEYVGQRAGEVVLTLRREESRWAVDYEVIAAVSRPPEAKTLPVRASGTPAATFLAVHEASKEWMRAVRVEPGSRVRVEFAVHLEDGRLAGWELGVLRRAEGPGGGMSRPVSSDVAGAVTRVLLPFTEGIGRRTVHLVLRVEHRPGEAEARGGVESAQVERPPPVPELSWYRAMHEATLLRWREGVHEGGAWLAQRGVEELSLWCVGGLIAHGTGSFATKGLERVLRALSRGPEAAAGWLSTTLKRLPSGDRKDFERLWSKVQLEGEKALTPSERSALRALMERIEQVVQRPLSKDEKNAIRNEAREYFKQLHPELERFIVTEARLYPVHHRRPLEHAPLFPDEDINAADNLVLLRDEVHKRINSIWTKLRNGHHRLTAQEVDGVARIIDRHFAERWYNRIDVPDAESELLVAAEEAVLNELRRSFPGLK